MSGGMGMAPLTFSELESWQRQIGIELKPWEVRLLRRLSGEYCAESSAATKADAPAPFKSIDERNLQRLRVARDIDESF
jgi:hypothetical protein